jgi:hypothetical protein
MITPKCPFCTIDKIMVFENSFAKPKKQKKRDSSLPFFINIVLIKN